MTTTCTYAIAYFLPIILNEGMGFGVAASQCLVAPPYVAAALWMYFCAVMADRYRIRGPWIIGNGIMGFIGLSVLGFAENVGECLYHDLPFDILRSLMAFRRSLLRRLPGSLCL